MATKIRRITTSIVDKLCNEPWRFEFFEAVRVLHLIVKFEQHKTDKKNFLPVRSKTNNKNSPLARIVNYRTHLSLNYPASDIQDFKVSEPDEETENFSKPPTMTVNFMGLIGPSGVMPRHYTEFLLDRRIRFKDETAHRFFDLFNHRAITLFVEAWEKYRFYIGYERGQTQNTMRYLLDLVGMGTTGLQGRLLQARQGVKIRAGVIGLQGCLQQATQVVKMGAPVARLRGSPQQAQQGVKDEMLAYYSGLNSQRPHSATALAAILQDYFGVKVNILQFQGQWLRLDPDQYTRIGKKGAYHKLGEAAVIGEYVWDHQAKFRIRIGPLTKKQFDAFLPIRYHKKLDEDESAVKGKYVWDHQEKFSVHIGPLAEKQFDTFLPIGNAFTALINFVNWYKVPGQNFEVQLVLHKDEIPKCCLGVKGMAHLGWSTWLSSQTDGDNQTFQTFEHDADDTIITC